MKTWIAHGGQQIQDQGYMVIAADTLTDAAAIAHIYGVSTTPELLDDCDWVGETPRLLFTFPQGFSEENARMDAVKLVKGVTKDRDGELRNVPNKFGRLEL